MVGKFVLQEHGVAFRLQYGLVLDIIELLHVHDHSPLEQLLDEPLGIIPVL